MRQDRDSVANVIRPPTKLTDKQAELLADAERAVRDARASEERAWLKMRRAREAGVPDPILCAHTEIARSTLNRKLGSRSKAAT